MGSRHGHQALDSGEGYSAALCGAHKAAADAILPIVLRRCGEDTVRTEALHGHGHTVCEVRKDRLHATTAMMMTIQHPGQESVLVLTCV